MDDLDLIYALVDALEHRQKADKDLLLAVTHNIKALHKDLSQKIGPEKLRRPHITPDKLS
jgi:hypothetical protein